MKKQLFLGFIFLLFVGFIACEKDEDTTTTPDTVIPTDTTGTPTDTTGTPTDTTGNGNGGGTITPSTLTLNTFVIDGVTYTITGDLTASAMTSLHTWGASGYTSDFKSSISISLKVTDAVRPSTTVTYSLKKYVTNTGDASVTLSADGKIWYSEGGTLNVVVDSKGDITIHFTDITFGDNVYGTSTTTEKGSGNTAIVRDYKGEFAIDSLDWTYTNAAAIAAVTENVFNTTAGFGGVNQHNKSGSLILYFQTGGISAGTYSIVSPVGGLTDVRNVGANEVHIAALVYYNSQTSAYLWGQSGSVIVTKSDGDVHFEFTDIPTDDGKGKTDKMTGFFDCKDM